MARTKILVQLCLSLALAACIERGDQPTPRHIGGEPEAGAERSVGDARVGEPPNPRPDASPDVATSPPELAIVEVPMPPVPVSLTAPARFDHLLPRLGFPFDSLYRNLVYEGNNIAMRGRRLPSGLYESEGAVIAGRWRRAAASVRGLFLLRDSLYSQQDHPTDTRPFAPMMPQHWVSVAVAETMAGRPLRPVRAPALEDDLAWGAFTTAAAMFGSFPPSARLFEWSRQPLEGAQPEARTRIENSRLSMRALADQAHAMIVVAPRGMEAVAEAGAEAISALDRAYFTPDLRRSAVIPIGVENPNQHEIEDEGKGLIPFGVELPTQAVALARAAIYRRRLRDGDLAVERYDLSQPSDRRRALSLLELLIPARGAGATTEGTRVWLWVNGPLDETNTHGVGEDATAYIAAFREEISRANINTGRLTLVSKPHVVIPRSGPASGRALAEAADRFRGMELPLSVNLSTGALRAILVRVPQGAGDD
jgi:hypothetical protein